MNEPRRRIAGAALVVFAASLWATFGPFARALYERGYTPIELASIRAWIGFIGAAAVLLVRRVDVRIPARSLLFFAAYGTFGFALFEYLYFAAVERTSIAIAAALLYTAPAFVALAARVLWGEHLGGMRLLALALVLAGVTLVTGAATSVLHGDVGIGGAAAALGLGAGATYALYTLFSKVSTQRFGAAKTLFWSFGFAAVALLPFAEPFSPMTRRPDALPLLLAMGLVPTLFAYWLYLRALNVLPATTAAMLASLEPVVAALLGVLLFDEGVGLLQGVGVALIVLAAVLLTRKSFTAESQRTQRPPHPT